ncbi:MAG: omptin family outer membrane protease [Treponema sp.]|nr:omptin family outer membrane protease [Treponema sp.]
MKHLLIFVFFVIILLFSANNRIYCTDDVPEAEAQETKTHGSATQEAAAKKHNTRKYEYIIAPFFGVIHGQSTELVYPVITKGELLSELIWDIKPVFYLGLKFDAGRRNIMEGLGVFASAAVKIGIPGDSGIMEDRDWQSVIDNALTNFSSHTNKTNEFFNVDVLIGMSIPLKYLYITPYISGSWMRFSFAGRDGYKKYARGFGNNIYYPIDDDPDVDYFSGEVIKYKQDWFLLAPGFIIGTNILSPFTFELSFQISPLTYCESIDYHLLFPKRTFYDYSSFGLFLEPKAAVSFKKDMFDFTFEFAYRYIGKTRGDSYIKWGDSKSASLLIEEAGAKLSFIDIRFLARIYL